jgi:RHS repeat-associated protein
VHATPALQSAVKASLTDPIGRTTTFTVTRWGQPMRSIDPAGDTTTVTYQGYLPMTVVHPTGGVDTMLYVTGTPLVSYVHAAGDSLVNYKYGAKNQVDSVWGPSLKAEWRFLNATTGRIDSIRYAGTNSLKTRYGYDSYNRLTSVTDPGTHVTTYAYDPIFGSVDSVSTPGNLYTITRFDVYGRDSATQSTGSSLWQRTAYDTINRVIKTWHAGTGVRDTTVFQYDSLYLVRVKTPGQLYKVATNALGWVTTRYDAYDTTKSMSFRYDTTGRMTSWTNRRSQRVDQTYDMLDRLLTRSISGTILDSLSYSTNGLVTRAVRRNALDSLVSRDSAYGNVNGLPDSLIHQLGGHRYAIRYTYTSPYAGVRRTVNYTSDAGITFVQETDTIHDTLSAVNSITLTGGHGSGTTVITMNTDGLPSAMQLPSGGSYVRPYYTAHHQTTFVDLTSDVNRILGDSLGRAITYDALGRVVTDHRLLDGTSHIPTRSFVYDSLGQLLKVTTAVDSACTNTVDTLALGYTYTCTHVVATATQDSATAYDSAGNRLFPGASYSATGNHLLTGPSGVSYTYDADGNVATRTHGGVTDALFWNAIGQLDSVVSGTLHHWYEYNTAGQLVRRQTKVGSGAYSVDRYFLWDGNQLIAELSGSSTRIAQYVYSGVDQPFALATDSAGTSLVRYFYQDPTEGNLTGILRDSLTLHQYTQYTGWGQQLSRSINTLADTNRLGWKGLMYEGDSTRLYYMRNRWYDPAASRFVSEDPIGINGGVNLYTFAHNDPINGRDPSGTCAYTDAEDGHEGEAPAGAMGMAANGDTLYCSGNNPGDGWYLQSPVLITANGPDFGWDNSCAPWCGNQPTFFTSLPLLAAGPGVLTPGNLPSKGHSTASSTQSPNNIAHIALAGAFAFGTPIPYVIVDIPVAFIPSTRTFCIGIGGGVGTPGVNVGVVGSTQNIQNVLQGGSISGSVQSGLQGVQGMKNSSGSAIGNSLGSPGGSITGSYSVCF